MATEAGTGAEDTPINVLAMSDEDILKAGIPDNLEAVVAARAEEEAKAASAAEAAAGGEQPAGETPVEGAAEDASGTAAEAGKEGASEAPAPAEGVKDPAKKEGEAAAVQDPGASPSGSKPGSPEGAQPDAQPEKKEGGEAPGQTTETKPADYEGFYKKVMAPFTANGKTIALRSPEEAVQLMQMGANYTRKMQELAPHRKMLAMLQNNNLLDENKLSFLIDLDKKNPEAIKKLIKDSGIDPMGIDTSVEPAYSEGSHRVTDEEVNFTAALGELSSTQEGQETLRIINTRWDQTSKDLLWKHPETLAMIDAQRKVGIYDRIVGEIDRQITLGQLKPQTPFLEAYQIVGDELTKANAFEDLKPQSSATATEDRSGSPGQGTPEVKPEPVATRVAAPKPVVANDDRASAASPTRTSNKTAQPFVNPLAMSDEDFMKSYGHFQGRV